MPQNYTYRFHGRQESTAPGTARTLGAGSDSGTSITVGKRNCSLVYVQALLDNSGNVTVAGPRGEGPAINATSANRVGTGLTPGESKWFFVDSIDELQLDVITSGDGVYFEAYE